MERCGDLQYQLLKIRRKKFGEMHHLTLASMRDLASTFAYQGKIKDAEKLRMQVFNLNTVEI